MSYGVGMAYLLSVYIVQNVHCTIMFLQTLTAKVCIYTYPRSRAGGMMYRPRAIYHMSPRALARGGHIFV